MRDGNSETETELQAAERRISKIQRCGAARVASMEQSFLGLLEAIGEDPQREGLVRTPDRAARAFEFLTAGYRQSLDGIINNALFESEASEIILVKDIELYSLCEHHLLPFIGKAHVAYIPNGRVVGLSKTARIVDMFARRLQIQENLTMQIADALMKALHPRGIPHGPHPGTIMASKNATRTEELAVMFDTQHTLELTEAAVALDDEKYPLSWLD